MCLHEFKQLLCYIGMFETISQMICHIRATAQVDKQQNRSIRELL
jgi:hypothetical protein